MPDPQNPGHAKVFIAVAGDWTTALYMKSFTKLHRPIFISRPQPSTMHVSKNCEKVLMVGSGVGIPPLMSLLQNDLMDGKHMSLLWVARDAHMIELMAKYIPKKINTEIYHTGQFQRDFDAVEAALFKQSKGLHRKWSMESIHTSETASDTSEIKLEDDIETEQSISQVRQRFAKAGSTPSGLGPAFKESITDLLGKKEEKEKTFTLHRGRPQLRSTIQRMLIQANHDMAKDEGKKDEFKSQMRDEVKRAMGSMYGPPPTSPLDQSWRAALYPDGDEIKQEKIGEGWLCIYCGAGNAVTKELKAISEEFGMKFRLEWFGSW
ncbi:unnamed protein product [Chrysoparadoxa australica]